MGIVFDIQRCCYQDGPGIRTTVFLKGCPLRCAWCHNPESFRREPQLQYTARLCAGCGACAQVCPNGVHRFENGVHTVDFSRCAGCGACARICPAHAVKLCGQELSAAQVMETVLRDRAYYDASGGGLTVSGGEPTFQPDFLLELLTLANKSGIHTCLETNGYIPGTLLPRLLEKTDMVLLDYKITGAEALRSYTGAGGSLWNDTLEALEARHIPVILRLPIIPGINDTPAHFREAAAIQAGHSCIQHTEIMAYHAIGGDKWAQLGYCYTLKGLPSATPEQKAAWEATLASFLPPASSISQP